MLLTAVRCLGAPLCTLWFRLRAAVLFLSTLDTSDSVLSLPLSLFLKLFYSPSKPLTLYSQESPTFPWDETLLMFLFYNTVFPFRVPTSYVTFTIHSYILNITQPISTVYFRYWWLCIYILIQTTLDFTPGLGEERELTYDKISFLKCGMQVWVVGEPKQCF